MQSGDLENCHALLLYEIQGLLIWSVLVIKIKSAKHDIYLIVSSVSPTGESKGYYCSLPPKALRSVP